MPIFSIFQYEFMIRAFVAGVAVSLIAPLIGTFLVVKRYSLISDTLSHIALAGVAIGLLLNTQPILTTVVVTVIASLTIEWLRTHNKIPGEAILAMFLPGGLALSITLISLAKGFNSNLFSYLFGSISTVTDTDIQIISILAAITLAIVVTSYKSMFFVSIDEEGAKVSGINTALFNNLLVVLTAIAVSVSMRVVGVLLIGALMVIPTVTAMQIARSFFQTLIYGVVFALSTVIVGLVLAYYFSLPAGGAIVLFSLFLFVLVTVFKRK